MTDYSRLDPRLVTESNKQDIVGVFLNWLSLALRPVIKGFLRLTTRLCELQRICYGEAKGGPRTIGVENSLKLTRSRDIQNAMIDLNEKLECGLLVVSDEKKALDEVIDVVLAVKKIKRNLHAQFVISLRFCLSQIWGYKQLVKDVEVLRSEAYNSENIEHERSLLSLWNLLRPETPLLKRKTKEWQSIGFQGDDPKTDFRGMGVLALQNLVYFADEYNTAAKYILSHSHHPTYGYSFAIVGINITSMACRLLNEGCAKSHFYNISASSSGEGRRPSLRNFHHFYSYLFVEFDRFWLEMKPSNMMSFNYVKELFENKVRNELKNPNACFKINIDVDTV